MAAVKNIQELQAAKAAQRAATNDDIARDTDVARNAAQPRSDAGQATVAVSVLGLGLAAQTALAERGDTSGTIDVTLASADPQAQPGVAVPDVASIPVPEQQFAALDLAGQAGQVSVDAPPAAAQVVFPSNLGEGLFPFVESRKQVDRDDMTPEERAEPVAELTPTSAFVGPAGDSLAEPAAPIPDMGLLDPDLAPDDRAPADGSAPPAPSQGGGLLDGVVGPDGIVGGVVDGILGEDGLLDDLLGQDGVVVGIVDDLLGPDGLVDDLLGQDGLVDDIVDSVLGEDGIVGGVIDIVAGEGGLLGENGAVSGVVDTVLGDDGIVPGVVDSVLGEDGAVSSVIDTVLGDQGVVTGLLEDGGVVNDIVETVLGDDGIVPGVVDSVLGDNGLLGSNGVLGLVPGIGGLFGSLAGQTVAAPEGDAPVDVVASPVKDVAETVNDLVSGTTEVVEDLIGTIDDDGFLESLLSPDSGTSLLDGLLGDEDVFALETAPDKDASEFDLFAGLTGIDNLSGALIDQGLFNTPVTNLVDDTGVDDLLTQILGTAVGGDAVGGGGNVFAELLEGTDQTTENDIFADSGTLLDDAAIDDAVSTIVDHVNNAGNTLLGGLFGNTADENDQ